MQSFSRKYILFLIAFTLAFIPVEPLLTVANAKEKTTKTDSKKNAKYAKAKASKEQLEARRQAWKEQQAIDLGENYDGSTLPQLSSDKVLVVNQNTGEVKYAKNSQIPSPIASITKLMTAMVMLDARPSLEEMIDISEQDVDTVKGTRSRLPVGTVLSRADMLRLALMASENRAAYALSRHYPGGRDAFVKAMNVKAMTLGLMNTRFVEPTGLMYQNKSTAEDLYKLVAASYQYPEIRNATTTPNYEINISGRAKPVEFKNTNKLVREGDWNIGLSKTGYINEAGRCLVMQTTMAGEPMIVVFLDAAGTTKRTGDANRIRKWVEYNHAHAMVGSKPSVHPKLVMSGHIYQN